MKFLLISLAYVIIFFAILIVMIKRAPMGKETENGFEYTNK